jgi:hypothetical protein
MPRRAKRKRRRGRKTIWQNGRADSLTSAYIFYAILRQLIRGVE